MRTNTKKYKQDIKIIKNLYINSFNIYIMISMIYKFYLIIFNKKHEERYKNQYIFIRKIRKNKDSYLESFYKFFY